MDKIFLSGNLKFLSSLLQLDISSFPPFSLLNYYQNQGYFALLNFFDFHSLYCNYLNESPLD
jgi:hypothetical protein